MTRLFLFLTAVWLVVVVLVAQRALAEPRQPSAREERTLACIARYEAPKDRRGRVVYNRANRSNTRYSGAFQFDQRTWDGVARRHAPQLVGTRPHQASQRMQRLMAVALLRERGLQPWPTPRRRCR